MFKVNNKNTRTTSRLIVDFEQVNISWVLAFFWYRHLLRKIMYIALTLNSSVCVDFVQSLH